MAQESVDRLRRAPSFALQEGSGRILELKDLRGKLVLLIFFKPG
jgi:peroxiredoxin